MPRLYLFLKSNFDVLAQRRRFFFSVHTELRPSHWPAKSEMVPRSSDPRVSRGGRRRPASGTAGRTRSPRATKFIAVVTSHSRLSRHIFQNMYFTPGTTPRSYMYIYILFIRRKSFTRLWAVDGRGGPREHIISIGVSTRVNATL